VIITVSYRGLSCAAANSTDVAQLLDYSYKPTDNARMKRLLTIYAHKH